MGRPTPLHVRINQASGKMPQMMVKGTSMLGGDTSATAELPSRELRRKLVRAAKHDAKKGGK